MIQTRNNDLLEFLWILFLEFLISLLKFLLGKFVMATVETRQEKIATEVNAKKGEDIWEICSNSVPMLAKIRFFLLLLLFVLCIYMSFISLRCSLSEPFIPFGHHTFFRCIKNIFWIPSKELWIVYGYSVAGMKETNNQQK